MYAKYFLAAITISFDRLIYFVNENNGTVELIVVLSNPSTTDIAVEIISSDVTAISTYAHYYNLFVNICMYVCIMYYIIYCIILHTYSVTYIPAIPYVYTNVQYI